MIESLPFTIVNYVRNCTGNLITKLTEQMRFIPEIPLKPSKQTYNELVKIVTNGIHDKVAADVSVTAKPKCTINNGGCPLNSVCSSSSTTGTVTCTCKTGYTNTGSSTSVVCTDSCKVNNGGCDTNAACSHECATYAVKCTCKNGFRNTGSASAVQCTDLCQINNGGCNTNAYCSHEPITNAVKCTCASGYISTGCGLSLVCKEGITCNPACKNNGKCTGKNTCTCPEGFSGPTCEIQSGGLSNDRYTCEEKPVFSVTFGAGSDVYSKAKPSDFGFSTTYQQRYEPLTRDGQFSFISSIKKGREYDTWLNVAGDHTGDKGGYMYLVNADNNAGQFFNGTIRDLVVGGRYEFSVYVANVLAISGIKPNVLFEVRSTATDKALLAQLTTGNIPEASSITWTKYGISFVASTSTVNLLMISNAPGGDGNDILIDDIALRACSAEIQCFNKCQNNGKCIGNNICTCPTGFSGPTCENIEKVCNPPCQNNGKCSAQNKCICPEGFSGSTCEIQSGGLSNDRYICEEKPVFSITFGAGSDQYSKAKPSDFGFSTTYRQRLVPVANDGEFSFINSLQKDREGTAWHLGTGDHTGDKGGYMYLVNADYSTGQFYSGTIKDLVVGRRYEFSVYVANLMTFPAIKPNVLFEVRSTAADKALLAQLSTGDIPEYKTLTWTKYGISFIASTSTVNLLMISNAPGGIGNDLVIDDIALRACSADVQCTPKCQNNGKCTGNNQCTCPTGFTGPTCENTEKVCNPPCQNNGKCSAQNTCVCTDGYTGPTCEIGSSGLSNDRYTCEEKPVFSITFGAGSDQYSKAKPSDFGFSTTYRQRFVPVANDGEFSFINSIQKDREGTAWHLGTGDHTGDKGGYMYLVNADYSTGQFYSGTIKDLVVGRRYEFSVYVANLLAISGIKPNVLFEVRSAAADKALLAQLSTGDIPEYKTLTWTKYGISFIASTSTVNLLMISNAPGGIGNDLVIDDITLRGCSGDVACTPACQNGGKCTGKNTCTCPVAFSGPTCENIENVCNPACKNKGKCTGKNTCTCPEGFSGPTCEIESSGLCDVDSTYQEKPVFSVTFGAGSDAYSKAKPADFGFSTSYQQKFEPIPNDGQFAFLNSIKRGREYDAWLEVAGDHTGDKGGYMYLVNADYNAGQFFNGTIQNLVVGKRYEFSVYLANPLLITGIQPNILFEVRSTAADKALLAQFTTGNIPEASSVTWTKYGISFVASTSTVNLLMISNAPGGVGNDILIDDIALRVCLPRDRSSDSGILRRMP
ncbi:hypothetical protein I4U23_022823 [Adineta vaga]|nr:hypothetical protein I4U23_022823 [Adineta vaga]